MFAPFMSAAVSAALVVVGVALPSAAPAATPADATTHPEVSASSHNDLSQPLRQLAREKLATGNAAPDPETEPNPPVPADRLGAKDQGTPYIPDPTGPGTQKMPAPIENFAGLSNDDNGATVYRPSDPNGDVGPNHYVHSVNQLVRVYDKVGKPLTDPISLSAFWSGFPGDCGDVELSKGDPIVQYDQFANRWLISKFSRNDLLQRFQECVAVSETPDPTGAWYRYSFDYENPPDYPKIGVWPDGYYATYNMYTPTESEEWAGVKICALERKAMLIGAPATQQCYTRMNDFSMLPADVDGPTPPPPGSPNYILGEGANSNLLSMYKMHVDWDVPGDTTLTGPIKIPVNQYAHPCTLDPNSNFACVPQKDTNVLLNSLAVRMMYRLAYRNFGGHESIVANHTVKTGQGEQTGIGWYELRDLGNSVPTVYQQGTSADPDTDTYRFVGSLAQDKQGNMALGYSASGSTSYPSIRYNGRLATDPLNQMPQAEQVIEAGGGAQTDPSGRWGDYSSMNVDPIDDCTFWYTNSYMPETSNLMWATKIASIKYPGCTGAATAPGTPTVSASPGNRRLTVKFSADNGGIPITSFTATASPGGETCATQSGVTPDPLTCTLEGLNNGETYTVTVKATNAIGESPASAPVAGTPRTVPGSPSSVGATPANKQATVRWTAPANDGGAAVTGYTATASPGGAVCTSTTTTCTVTGLTNGKAYTFTVTAQNAAGPGVSSAPSAAVTPFAVKQKAKVSTPKKIKSKGKTVLLKSAVTTNANQRATAKVTTRPKGKKYAKVTISSKGKVTIQTKGRKALLVTLRLTAPATAKYRAYKYSQAWKVPKP